MKPEEYPRETSYKYTNIVTGVLEYFERMNIPGQDHYKVIYNRFRKHDTHWIFLLQTLADIAGAHSCLKPQRLARQGKLFKTLEKKCSRIHREKPRNHEILKKKKKSENELNTVVVLTCIKKMWENSATATPLPYWDGKSWHHWKHRAC